MAKQILTTGKFRFDDVDYGVTSVEKEKTTSEVDVTDSATTGEEKDYLATRREQRFTVEMWKDVAAQDPVMREYKRCEIDFEGHEHFGEGLLLSINENAAIDNAVQLAINGRFKEFSQGIAIDGLYASDIQDWQTSQGSCTQYATNPALGGYCMRYLSNTTSGQATNILTVAAGSVSEELVQNVAYKLSFYIKTANDPNVDIHFNDRTGAADNWVQIENNFNSNSWVKKEYTIMRKGTGNIAIRLTVDASSDEVHIDGFSIEVI